jgi:hypothetical protein
MRRIGLAVIVALSFTLPPLVAQKRMSPNRKSRLNSGDCRGDAPSATSPSDRARGVRPDAHLAARATLPPIVPSSAATSGVSVVGTLELYSDHMLESRRSRQFNPSQAFLEA